MINIGTKLGKFTVIGIERDKNDRLDNYILKCNYCGNIIKRSYSHILFKVKEANSFEYVGIICDKCGPVGCTGLVAGTWLGKLKLIGFDNRGAMGKVRCVLECEECGNIVRYDYNIIRNVIKKCIKKGKDLTSLKLRCVKCDARAGRRKILGLKIGKLVVDRCEKNCEKSLKYVLKCEYGHENIYAHAYILRLLRECDVKGIDYSNANLTCEVCEGKNKKV